MTRKVYKSAMGKPVDLGALLLQNEQTRAVGNMNVNARGDALDGANRVIDSKNKQVQRQYQRTTASNVSDTTPVQSTRVAKQAAKEAELDLSLAEQEMLAEFDEGADVVEPVAAPEPLPENTFGPTGEGGLAAAIARSRLIKQEKEKTLKEKQQAQGLIKI